MKKNIFKPKLKLLVDSKILLLKKKKVLSLKKKKWKRYVSYILRLNEKKKKNCYYKFYDQRSYNISRFLNRFNNSFKYNLLLKRRFKLLYGNLKTRYVKNLIKNAFLESKGSSISHKNHFMCLLESRIDIVLVKSYFAVNIRSARQLISHGNVNVNGNLVKNNALSLKCGDKITIKQTVQPLLEYRLANNKMWVLPPKHLQVNYKIFQVLVLFDPLKTNLSNNFNNKLNFDTIFHLYKF